MFINIDHEKRPSDYKLHLAKPNKEIISVLHEKQNSALNLKLGNISELNFSIPYFVEDSNLQMIKNPNIERIRELMYVKLTWGEFEEWFLIDNITESSEDNEIMNVQAFSIGYENKRKKINEFKETAINATEFYTEILKDSPWSIGEIDSSFDLLYRSFDESGTDRFELIKTGAETFGGVIVWDTNNKKINLKEPDNIGEFRGLTVSYDRLMSSLNKTRTTDEMVTRLYVYGNERITIENKNPTNEKYIEDYSYFMHPFKRDANKNVLESSYYMSDSLCHALLDNKELRDEYEPQIKTIQGNIENKNASLSLAMIELNDAEFTLMSARGLLDIAKAVDDKALIEQRKTEVVNATSIVNTKKTTVNNLTSQIEGLQNQVSVLQNAISVRSFTKELIDELEPYIIEKEIEDARYIDEDELYEFAKEKFSEIREPRVVIETGIEGLMNSVEEQYYWDKLNLGDTMRVRQKRMNIDYRSQIIEMNIGLDDSDVEVKIANFTENVDNLDKFISILYSSESNSTILNNNKYKWDSVVDIRDEVTQLRESEIDATTKRITAGVNESVEIGDRGVVITTPSFPNEMIIMQAGVIALSEDGGETWKTSVTPRGVIADTIIGKLVASNNLIVTNDSGSMVLDGTGLTVDADSIKIMSGGANPKNIIEDWNNMIIDMDNFADDNVLTPYEKSQVLHQWNMISDAHTKLIESFIDNMGNETVENSYPLEYDIYLETYERLKNFLFLDKQSDGYSMLDSSRMQFVSPVSSESYRSTLTNYMTAKDDFILVIPMEYTNASIRVLEEGIFLEYVKSDELVASLNLSEEGVRIDGKLLSINSETRFRDDVVMDAGVIKSADNAIRIDLNAGTIDLARPLTINAVPVATKGDIDAIELQEGKSAYDIAKENGYTGTEAQWLESLKGKDGANGTAGTKGADGRTSYLHIAYATSADGSTGFSTTVSTGKTFIGQYTDFVEADSSDYTKYSWSKFKGEDGYTPVKGTDYFDGKDGQDGSDGDSSFLWVRYSQNANGNPMTDSPTDAKYVGLATTSSSTAPTAYSAYKWSLVKGTDGINGEKGANGQTSYLHIKYSNDGGTTFTANNGETVGSWIGTYVDFTEADSTLVSKYTWNKVKGDTGAKGLDGISPIVGFLTNESITLPASSAGVVPSFTGATGTFNVYEGTVLRNTSASYSVVSQSGITVSITQSGVYTVSAMTTGASVLSGTATLRAVYGGVTIDKILTITKALAGTQGGTGATGSAGQNATSYWINASTNAIKKDVAGNIVPKTITFSGFSKTGTANPVAYAGRFIIQTSTDGVSYTTAYTSSANQSSYTYTVPTTASFVKARYYLANGTSILLDEQTVPVLVDAEGVDKKYEGQSLLDKTVLSGTEIFTDKADDSVVHVEVDGKSVGGHSGKNLLSGLVSGYVSFHGTISRPDAENMVSEFIEIDVTKEYVYSSWVTTKTVGNWTEMGLYDVNKNFIARATLDSNSNLHSYEYHTEYLKKYFTPDTKYIRIGSRYLEEGKAQLEEGSTATEYEPPAPTPDYPIEIHSLNDFDVVSQKSEGGTIDGVQVGGRNLFPQSGDFESRPSSFWVDNGGGLTFDDSITYNGYGTIKTYLGEGIAGSWLKLENGVEYTYSVLIRSEVTFEGTWNAPLHYHAGNSNRNQYKITILDYMTSYTSQDVGKFKKLWITFKLTSDADSFKPFLYWGVNRNVNIAYLKLEKGNKATDWTPAPEDITENDNHPLIDKTNILLSEPLRSVGDVKDRLFLDTDGLWKVERNVRERVVSSGLLKYGGPYYVQGYNFTTFQISIPDRKMGFNTSISSHLLNLGKSTQWDAPKKVGYNDHQSFTNLYLYMPNEIMGLSFNEATVTANQKANQWISQNPITFLYVLATPTIETLSQADQDKLNNIASFKDSNYVYTIVDKTNILPSYVQENLKPTLHATFKGGGWYARFKTEQEFAKAQEQLGNKADKETVDDISSGIENLQSQILQYATKNEVSLDMAEYQSKLVEIQQSAKSGLEKAKGVETAVNLITNQMGVLAESWVFTNNYIKFAETSDLANISSDAKVKYPDIAVGAMLISNNNGSSKMLLTNNSLFFISNNEVVTAITDSYMNVDRAIFVSSAQIGSHKWSPSPTNEGHFLLEYVKP